MDSDRSEIPETVILAQGGLAQVREMKELLRKNGLAAEVIQPPEGAGSG
ncbi:MAG TPA: hypothetical protein QF764_04680 [Planctomycetota bacterium]|jgi:hypothetical protein|nr:hypothetical protein [Planctomycetota bacterium]